MNDVAASDDGHDAALEAALAAMESALESSDPDKADEVLRQFPDLTLELEEYRANRAELESITQPLREAASGVAGPPEIEGYRVLQLHDEGGMGFIYRAHYERLNQVVALKVMRDDRPVCEDDIRRFRREARCASDLDHPSIISVYDIGSDANDHTAGDSSGGNQLQQARPFYAMELVMGESLKERLENQGKFDPHDAAEMMLAIAEAMGCAHREQIVHRDLKPANILIDRHDHPRIIDFGLARAAAEPDIVEPGTFVGTPFYCSPEQADFRPHQAGPPADVYSLGAILYEMLTGQPPLLGANYEETLAKVCQQQPPQVSQLEPRVKPTLAAICTRCLQKNPADRYPNAYELAEDLRRFLNGKKLSPLTARFQHWHWPWNSDEAYRERISQIGGTLLLFQAVYLVSLIGVQLLLVYEMLEPLAWLLALGGLVPLFFNLRTDDSQGLWASNRPERLLWSIWTAVVMSHLLLLAAMRIRFGYVMGFHSTYAVLPFVAGVAFFVMGASFWRTNMLWGLLWMLLGVVVVAVVPIPWSPICFAAFCTLAIFNLVFVQAKRRKEVAEFAKIQP